MAPNDLLVAEWGSAVKRRGHLSKWRGSSRLVCFIHVVALACFVGEVSRLAGVEDFFKRYIGIRGATMVPSGSSVAKTINTLGRCVREA